MKLLTFRPPRARSGRLGVLLSQNRVLDSGALTGLKLPATLPACIEGGESALAALRSAVADTEAALTRGDLAYVYALDAVKLEAPLIPGKIMAVGKNYAEHAAEGSGAVYSRVSGFIKLTSSIVASGSAVAKPAWTEQLDYEGELATVIATKCSDVAPEAAYDHVFGYTIMNDLSCREIQAMERKEGNICIAKNFPGAAPLGPWIVTKDEIPDPHNLRIVTRVNGEKRQDSNTHNQIYHIPAQIAWYSRAGFEPGDIISSGSPAGTAMGYKGEGSWYLKPGDHIEVEIEGIGMLTTKIVKRK